MSRLVGHRVIDLIRLFNQQLNARDSDDEPGRSLIRDNLTV